MKYEAVLLDIDGTLVDSNDAHTRAWLQAITEFKFETDYATVRKKIGMGGDKLLPSTIGIESDSDIGKKISELRARIFKEKFLPSLSAFPGTPELLQHMISRGFRLIVATSATKADLKAILDQAKISEFLHHQVTSEDVENSKPSPDILQAALKKMKVSPQEAIMIGDTPYDIEAAARAHIGFIAFKSGGWGPESFKNSLAFYEGAAHLLEKFDESPLGKKGSE